MSVHKEYEKRVYKSKYATIGTRRPRTRKLPADDYRTDFQRDAHRIIYSQPFRRLRHKTQVFYFPKNDHVSTRLDHVLFVAAASKTVARCLGLNEDLAEAIGLAHDIGHAPYGHQGEKILSGIINNNGCALRKIIPKFQHEIYGLRVVDLLAKRDGEKPGLDLTWEVRDGIISHCGEDFKTCKLKPFSGNKNLNKIKDRKKDAKTPATLEGCIVRLVDKIVYAGKDVEDAIASNIIKRKDVPTKIREPLIMGF
ncbi:MAG: dNTP triphosphohydrolase [Sedimentisphaerales bacterium]|nr:dNTP triphosphohydrolase [Sedimentisphaerales bacterium]